MTDSAKPTLLVVDGHSLAYRAFFALPVDNFSTKDGQHTNGIYGFLSMLINLIKAEKPTHMAVAFDTSRQSFRTREYTEYKANRSETPSEFKGQIPILQDCLAAMSITVLQKEDFEADDILATLATQGAEQGFDVLVCSGDRDTIQLVNDDITLLYPNVQGVSQLKRYDRAGRDRALRRAARAVPRHRRARRRDERQPARACRRSARRPRSSGSASSARSTRCSRTPTR